MRKVGIAVLATACTVILSASGTLADEARRALFSNKVPQEYQNKRMPDGWWTDPKIIAYEHTFSHGGRSKPHNH